MILTWSNDSCTNGCIYNASAHTVSITSTGDISNNMGLVDDETIASIISLTNNSNVNAGTYTATAKISETGNYYQMSVEHLYS